MWPRACWGREGARSPKATRPREWCTSPATRLGPQSQAKVKIRGQFDRPPLPLALLNAQDGRVRLWDMHGEQPQLLISAPASAAAVNAGLRQQQGEGLRSVTVLELR